MGDLKARLKDIRRENADFRWFIPQKLLRCLMEREVIQGALHGNVKPYQVQEISERVVRSGIKIFAVLVLIDQPSCITLFIEKDQLHDLRIPFERNLLQTIFIAPYAADFAERQWEFTAPEYFRGTLTRSLSDRVVLPFVKDMKIDEGGFGTVFEIEIHKEHQDLESCFQRKLVRKQLDDLDTHRVELENLSILGSLKHPNILELLTSYTHRGVHNLVFPLAEGGNLAQLLNGSSECSALQSQEAFFIALTGLASAIESVHTFVDEKIDLYLTGFHHDLRPKNILVQGSTLTLADFGLTKFKDGSEHSDTSFREGTGDYVAPECEDITHEYEKLRIRRSSDIWSFGCILAEIATYIVHGATGVKEFRAQRKFSVPHHHGQGSRTFTLFHCGPIKENDAVVAWLNDLNTLGSNSLSMLINLIRRMLAMNESQRPKASEVTSELRIIALKLLVDELEQSFSEVQGRNNSIDGTIEHGRFNSWTYATGILTHHMSNRTPSTISMADFKAILDTLSQMRNQLRAISFTDPGSNQSAFVPISRLNNFLIDLLNDEQQEISITHFKASLIKSNTIDMDVLEEMKAHGLTGSIKVRLVLSQMEKLILDHSERDTYHRQLNINSVRIGKVFCDHNIATLAQDDHRRRVLVEWHQHSSDSVDETVSTELFGRLETLTGLLSLEKPLEFRILDCRGFFHDPSRYAFGVVFELPGNPDEALTLTDLIPKTPSVVQQPLLESKYKLASILAQLVLEFHVVGWLHKRLKPSNIAFFPKTRQKIDDLIQNVFIIGFNHSRPDEPNAFTDGFRGANGRSYQHPLYLSGTDRYRPEFDYYSLGLILLEIGLWKPMKELVSQYLNGPAETLRNATLSRVPLLGQTMGSVYRDAVAACIKGQFSSSDDSTLNDGPCMGKHFDFEKVVVIPLKRLSNG